MTPINKMVENRAIRVPRIRRTEKQMKLLQGSAGGPEKKTNLIIALVYLLLVPGT